MSDNIHEGHRERVKNEFLAHGFDKSTPPHKILELLLFYSVPRRDTNPLAHRLLKRFGSLSDVFDASVEELCSVEGVTLNTATLIKLVMPISRQYNSSKATDKRVNRSIEDIGDYLMSIYAGYTNEVCSVVALNGKGQILGVDTVSYGDVNTVNFSMRDAVQLLISRKAVAAILVHNHPGGNAVPSDEDMLLTKNLKNVLSHMNIQLLDHIIIADGDYVSMAKSRFFCKAFEG